MTQPSPFDQEATAPEAEQPAQPEAEQPAQPQATTAQTAPKSRQRTSARDKAQHALEIEVRRVESLQGRLEKARADVAELEVRLKSAKDNRDYLASNPALKD